MTAGGRAGQARCCSSRPSRWCPAAAAACGQCRLCTRRPPPRTRRWPPRARPPLKRTTGRTRPAARLRCRCCRARRMATGQQPRGRRAAPPRAPAPQVSGLRCATVHVHGFFQVMAEGRAGASQGAGSAQQPDVTPLQCCASLDFWLLFFACTIGMPRARLGAAAARGHGRACLQVTAQQREAGTGHVNCTTSGCAALAVLRSVRPLAAVPGWPPQAGALGKRGCRACHQGRVTVHGFCHVAQLAVAQHLGAGPSSPPTPHTPA